MLRLRKRFSKWQYVTLSLASFAACFISYGYISQSVLENKQLAIFLPTYQKIFDGAYSIFIDNSERLIYDIFISVSRVAIGFIAAVIVSLPLGILIGSFSLFEAIFQPLIEFCRYIPVPALIPVLMAIFGIGEQAKIMLIFVGTFVQLTLMISDNISRVSMNYLHAAESMGATTTFDSLGDSASLRVMLSPNSVTFDLDKDRRMSDSSDMFTSSTFDQHKYQTLFDSSANSADSANYPL